MPSSAIGHRRRGREGDDLAAKEDFHAVVELAESAGGEPEEFRKDCGADDRSLFGFYQGDGKIRAEGEQVLSEQALGQRPILWQLMQCFKSAVHPHCRWNGAVLDAVASSGIVGGLFISVHSVWYIYYIELYQTCSR